MGRGNGDVRGGAGVIGEGKTGREVSIEGTEGARLKFGSKEVTPGVTRVPGENQQA
jgi:hypothetical protein